MDTLIAGHQTYGGSVSESQDLLAKLAPVLQGANMGWQQGTELINLFNAAGVDASAGITGMTKALGEVESPEELQALLVDIATTVDPFERAQKAIDAFGAKAGPKLAQALQASGGDLSRFGFELEDDRRQDRGGGRRPRRHPDLEAAARGQPRPRRSCAASACRSARS